MNAKILACLRFLHIHWNLTESTFSKNFKICRRYLHKWEGKSGQKFYKSSLTLTLPTLLSQEIPENVIKLIFIVGTKAVYKVSLGQISALCATYCTSYAIEVADRGLKIDEFGFQDILTGKILNLNTVRTSKSKLKLTAWRNFYWT